jgi:RluA family pseudouridine synthase
LNQFLADQLLLSKTKVKQLLDSRTVFVNCQRVWVASFRLKSGDIVETQDIKKTQQYSILFEDEFLLVVNKPAGIVTNGEHSLETKLKRTYQNIQAIHRLDKDTSGVVLFAKTSEIFEKMKKLFVRKEVYKEYAVLVQGHWPKNMTITTPIDGESAVSHVQILRKYELYTYIRVEIETGRKHQIRIHCANAGHPVLGEKQYVQRALGAELYRQVPRQMLHAVQLKCNHPITQAELFFSAPLPDDFKKYI